VPKINKSLRDKSGKRSYNEFYKDMTTYKKMARETVLNVTLFKV
jgi:hypothetical protein